MILPTLWNQNTYIFIVFVTIRTSLFLTMEQSKKEGQYPYNPATVVLLLDLAKLVVTLFCLYFTGNGLREVYQFRKTGVYFSLPALLYTLNNNLLFYNSVYFDMASMRVLYNFRVITSGFLTQIIFGHSLGSRKWLAITLLFIGCVICQWNGLDLNRILPVLLMLLQCIFSSLSGVVNDYLMKKDPDLSIHVQNMYLYLFNFLFNLGAAMISDEDISLWSVTNFFKGYSFYTYLVIINFVLVGLMTAVFLKHLSAILKEFASALEMITIALIGNFLFGDSIKISVELVVSIVLVSYALYLYNYDKWGSGTVPNQPGDIENQRSK